MVKKYSLSFPFNCCPQVEVVLPGPQHAAKHNYISLAAAAAAALPSRSFDERGVDVAPSL